MRTVAAVLVCLVLGTGREALGQTDTLFVGGQLVDLSSGPKGSSGSAEWLHAFSAARSLNVGVSSFSLAEARWTFGRLGGTVKPTSRATLHAETEIGSGAERHARFGYRTFRGSLGYEVVSRRLLLEFEDQYVDVSDAAGNVIKLGVTAIPIPSLVLSAAVHGTTSGSVDTRTVTFRAGYERGRASVFGGLATGRSRPVLVSLGASGPSRRLTELFGGMLIPVGRLQLTLAFDRLVLGGARRESLMMSWKVPL